MITRLFLSYSAIDELSLEEMKNTDLIQMALTTLQKEIVSTPFFFFEHINNAKKTSPEDALIYPYNK